MKNNHNVSTVDAATDAQGRHLLDLYRTHSGLTHAFVEYWQAETVHRSPLEGLILEPTAGDLAIVNALQQWTGNRARFLTNDINPDMPTDLHYDATDQAFWDRQSVGLANWVITNPPFGHAPLIVPKAYAAAQRGVAMLLRLSWLEPCQDRRGFLTDHPPNYLYTFNPRPKFRLSKKGKPATDNVTVSWFIWDKAAQHVGTIHRSLTDWQKWGET